MLNIDQIAGRAGRLPQAARNRLGALGRAKQKGVVLMVALIVLVALTLAGISLMRSVDTSTMIAGNLAFHQSATNFGDTGIEIAIGFLEVNSGGSTLHNDILAQGYSARRLDPTGTQSWDLFWNTVLVPNGQVITMPIDATTGNTVAYTIQRLCSTQGDPLTVSVDCAIPPNSNSSSASSSKGAGFIQIIVSNTSYYRITSRIEGPRKTVSYVQSIVAL